MVKLLVLGGGGFVGHHIVNRLSRCPEFDVFVGGRNVNTKKSVVIDISDPDADVSDYDVVINSSGYGVIKTQQDSQLMDAINYKAVAQLFDKFPDSGQWIQIGSAFEYDLDRIQITEETDCLPQSDYGKTKLKASLHLQNSGRSNFKIIRPFGMFGPGEDLSKFFPALIHAQQRKIPVHLSSGQAERDYFYVGDLANWLVDIVSKTIDGSMIPNIINVGSGECRTLRDWAACLADEITDFDPRLWQWGGLSDRNTESTRFFSASTLAKTLGFSMTPLPVAFKNTINSYRWGS